MCLRRDTLTRTPKGSSAKLHADLLSVLWLQKIKTKIANSREIKRQNTKIRQYRSDVNYIKQIIADSFFLSQSAAV